ETLQLHEPECNPDLFSSPHQVYQGIDGIQQLRSDFIKQLKIVWKDRPLTPLIEETCDNIEKHSPTEIKTKPSIDSFEWIYNSNAVLPNAVRLHTGDELDNYLIQLHADPNSPRIFDPLNPLRPLQDNQLQKGFLSIQAEPKLIVWLDE